MYHAILKKFVPLPDIQKMKNAVFVGPHPDDIEIGAGGTVQRMVLQGTRVTFVIGTDGRCGSVDPNISPDQMAVIRQSESRTGAARLGVHDVLFLGFPDAGAYSEWDMSLRLATVLASIRPDIVFCPDPNLPSETHPDHLRVANATRTAVFLNSFPSILRQHHIPFEDDTGPHTPKAALAYYFTHRPNQWVGLNKNAAIAKNEAILCHNSQFSGPDSPEWKGLSTYLRLRQRAMGWRAWSAQAEGFFTMAPIHQHCFPEVLKF